MKHSKICLFLLLFALLSTPVFAYTMTTLRIGDTLFMNGTANETVVFTLSNNTLKEYIYPLPPDAHTLYVNRKPANITNDSAIITLNCIECEVRINYQLRGGIFAQENESQMTLGRTFNLEEEPHIFNYTVGLPEGTYVAQMTSEPSIVPGASAIRTDGRRIILAWTTASPQFPLRYHVRFTTQAPTDESNPLDAARNPASWPLIIISFMTGALIGALSASMIGKHLSRRRLPFVPSTLLSPDERAVIALLRRKSGVLHQREMVTELSWSKSKVSAVVSNLLYKKMIEKEKLGRNYKVILKAHVAPSEPKS